MTLIVKQSVLTHGLGRTHYRGEPFNGVGLTIVEGIVRERSLYRNGQYAGVYSNPYFCQESALHIEDSLLDGLEEAYGEPYRYQGTPFSGTAYRFDGGHCWLEMQCRLGYVLSETGYESDGSLDLVAVDDDAGFAQTYSWYASNHQLKLFRLVEQQHFGTSIEFEEIGAVKVLSIDGDYFERIKEVGHKVRFRFFGDPDFVKGRRAASYLHLGGDLANDSILSDLLADDGLANTSSLSIFNTSISAAGLLQLRTCGGLQKLNIASKRLSLEEVKRLKSGLPGCLVVFNDQVVD